MIVLHAGLHKTGTTTLQRDILPQGRGYTYGGREYRDHGLLDHGIGADTLVLSDETLLGRLFDSFYARNDRPWVDENVARIAWLGRHLPESRLILSIRRTDRWLLSIYKHYLKYGGTAALPDFLTRLDRPDFLAWRDLHLMPRLHALEQAFPGRTLVFFMEELIQEPQRLLAELGSFLTGDPACFADVGILPQRNEGVSRLAAAVLRRLNAVPWFGRVGDLRNRTLPARAWRRLGLTPANLSRLLTLPLPARPLEWSAAQRDHIRQHCAADLQPAIAWIRERRSHHATPFLDRLGKDA
jgi:hypothetical protein